MDQMEICYTIIPVFDSSPDAINESKTVSSITISDDCSLKDLFDRIKQKEYYIGTNILPIGFIYSTQMIDFTLNEILCSSLHEFPSPMIYMFTNIDKNTYTDDNRQIDREISLFRRVSHKISDQNRIYTLNGKENSLSQLNNALKSIHCSERFQICLFIHIYKITDENINQIIVLQNVNDQLIL